jgi:hypothetical protein
MDAKTTTILISVLVGLFLLLFLLLFLRKKPNPGNGTYMSLPQQGRTHSHSRRLSYETLTRNLFPKNQKTVPSH